VATGGTLAVGRSARADQPRDRALIAITLDLEMSRHFPVWEQTEWDYKKGLLDDDTKRYSVEAARRVKAKGGLIHFFSVARVCEQEYIDWLEEIAADGHPIGNHTYDHVNVLATKPEQIQFRFRRAPWLIAGRTPAEVIAENIRTASRALEQRAGIKPAGFRTPGGFHTGLTGRPDVQKMLLDQGFTWVSSKYPRHDNCKRGERPSREVFESIRNAHAQAQPFVYPTGLVEVPMNPISDVGAFRSASWRLEDFLRMIREAVAWAIDNKGVFDFLCHPSCMHVADPEFRTVELICDLVREAGDRAAIVDLDTIARRASA
jgi:peptidoglycan/xylan/chitin deacetylase (PgdA/CDA1 family)